MATLNALDPRFRFNNPVWDVAYGGSGTDDELPVAPTFNMQPDAGGAYSLAMHPSMPQPSIQGTQEYQDFENVGNRLRAALQPQSIPTWRAILGSFVGARNPTLGSVITGDYQRQRQIQPLMQQYNLLAGIIDRNRQMQTQDITNRLHSAQADFFSQRPDLEQSKQSALALEHRNQVEGVLRGKGLQGVWDENGNLTGTQPLPGAPAKRRTALTDLSVKGENHKVLVDEDTGDIIKDMGPSKLPVAAPGAGDTRLDNGYKFITGQLSTIGKPIADALDRVSRLELSINERTPQADSLIAPELLTAMAGGQGSGLRMNEAEISRIVGGRTNFEALKAALNKWQLDPSKGLSITEAQRGQIKSLINKRSELLRKKSAILDEAQQSLIDAPDVLTQRRILADTKKKLSAIDQDVAEAGGQAAPSQSGAIPTFRQWKAKQ